MAEIPSEPRAEQATEQRVGWGKSCSILTRVEGRAGGGSVLAPPQIPPGWAVLVHPGAHGDVGRAGVATYPPARDGEAQPPSQIAHGVF